MKFNQCYTGVVKLTALLMVMFASGAGASATQVCDTIYIQKNTSARWHRIKLYPDVNQKVVFFSVRGAEAKVYQLYIFDIDAKLVKQAETRNKETTILKGIEKGNYLYEVFSDDKRIGNGQIVIR